MILTRTGAHGGDATVAGEFARQLRSWDRDQRGGPGPVLRVYPGVPLT
ncbi:hypothetical protein ACFWPV_33650 [Streptomyces uncialis]